MDNGIIIAAAILCVIALGLLLTVKRLNVSKATPDPARLRHTVEVVLRPFVIGDHEFLCRQAARLRAVRRNLRFTVEGPAT